PHPTLRIGTAVAGFQLAVTIEDNGVGIPTEILDKIYLPNFTTKVEGLSLGLGLGLTIVQRIVAEHEGDIRVISKPGCTRFTVLLNLPNRKP
ncbi:MAG TPA: hypothetical protein DCP28_28090, partial [Cytophagales bacterium]|nr:hypothetical protein [Cytophagales bacterium]